MQPVFEFEPVIVPVVINKPSYHVIGLKEHHEPIENGPLLAIAEQWNRFIQRIHEIKDRESSTVGVCFDNDGRSPFDYVAGALVTEGDHDHVIPSGMCSITLEPQTYAIFTHIGPIAKLGETYTAIHTWLNHNQLYIRAQAPDFELYDHRYKDAVQEDSEFDVYIPVILK